MFWRKKQECCERVELAPPEIISCTTCRALVYKRDAGKVRVGGYYPPNEALYCLACKPPYDRIVFMWGPNRNTFTRYYKELPAQTVEVDEKGILVIQSAKDV